jgi:hypothetical protein
MLAEAGRLLHPDGGALPPAVAEALVHGRAPLMWNRYTGPMRAWAGFAASRGASWLPTEPELFAEFLATRAISGAAAVEIPKYAAKHAARSRGHRPAAAAARGALGRPDEPDEPDGPDEPLWPVSDRTRCRRCAARAGSLGRPTRRPGDARAGRRRRRRVEQQHALS